MSLLPPVLIELKANASEFMSAMDEANKKVEQLGNQGATVGQKIKEHLGQGLLAGGAAATAAGGLLLEMGDKLEQSQKQLEQSIADTGHSYDDYSSQISKTVNHMENLNHGASDTNEALQKLTQASQDPAKALADMALVADIAAAKHESLSEAAAQVVKMHTGAAKSFKEFGVVLTENEKKTGDYSAAMDEVAKRVHGQAEAAVDSFGGHLSVLKTHLMDVVAGLGEKLGPALVTVGPLAAGLGGIIQSGVVPMVAKAIVGFASMAAGAVVSFATMVASALAWAASMLVAGAEAVLALAPILVPLALIGVAAYELYQHWDAIWSAIQAVIEVVWNAISGIVTTYVNAVKTVIETEINVIRQIITDVLNVYKFLFEVVWSAIFGLVAGYIGFMRAAIETEMNIIRTIITDVLKVYQFIFAVVFGFIRAVVTTEINVVRTVISTAINFIKDLFATEVHVWQTIFETVFNGIETAVTSVWGVITGAVRGGVNEVIAGINILIRALDAIQIHIPSVGIGPVHTPGFDWNGMNIPMIPEWREMGGPVFAGMPYIVGEKRAELFVPSTSGRIEPSVPSGGATVININVNAGMGTDGAQVGQQIVAALRDYQRTNGPVPITTRVA